MGEELAKLLVAGFIRDIKHPDWLANLVMVPKKDKSWHLCVDFKDLNKAADILARISAKRDVVPPNIFLERLFKPSVLWEEESGNNKPEAATPNDTEQFDINGDSAAKITPSAHDIMAVIAPWTEPSLAYLLRQELPEDQNEARCRCHNRRISGRGSRTMRLGG